jgi:hypothetical protein
VYRNEALSDQGERTPWVLHRLTGSREIEEGSDKLGGGRRVTVARIGSSNKVQGMEEEGFEGTRRIEFEEVFNLET